MKIYNLLFLTVLSCFALSCSQDKFEDHTFDESTDRLAAGQFDNSYLGVYKGLFSTHDGLTRGSVVLTLSPNNVGIAQITLSSGEVIELQSRTPKLSLDNSVSNLTFSSAGLGTLDASLSFSVDANGANPSIGSVNLDNKPSDILVAKNLSRVPLTIITGTYMRTAGTGGFPTSGRTWNIMVIGTGNQTYATQIWFGGSLYNTPPIGSQSNCAANGNLTTCDITGSANILGYAVAWSGTHIYDPYNDNLGCSEVSGTWSASSYGGSSGTFVSDSNCNDIATVNDVCANAIAIVCGESVNGYTDMATNTGVPASCGTLNTGPGVWYTFSTPTAQVVTVDTVGSSFDTKLGVFSGACGTLVCVAANNDAFGIGLQSRVTFIALANTTYYFYVTGFQTQSGSYTLNVACVPIVPFTTYTPSCGGYVVDHAGNPGIYSNNRNDTYTIDAGEGLNASLTFIQFNIEDTWDFMRIYDGNSVGSPQIMTAGTRSIYVHPSDPARSGFTGTGTGANSLEDQTVTSSGRYLTVVFTSNGSNLRAGFFAPVTCVAGRSAGDTSIQKTSETFMPQPSPSVPKVIEREVAKSKK